MKNASFNTDNSAFLIPTETLDFQSENIQEFIFEYKDNTLSEKEKLRELYLKVRDLQLYDPYHLDLRPEALKASTILTKKRAWCVEKAILFTTCARGLGYPAKLGFAIVLNHLGADKLKEYLKRKEIVFHGYSSVFIDNTWVRCTPAFDKKICRLTGVPALNWDAENDSLFQQEINGGKFMEYTHHYGEFADIPFQLMESEMKTYYPHLFSQKYDSRAFSFHHSESI
jgi:hypothetical protein